MGVKRARVFLTTNQQPEEYVICHSNGGTVQGLEINPNNLWAQSTTAGGEKKGVCEQGE